MAATANGDSFANQRSNSTEKTPTESFSPAQGKAWLSIFRAAIAKIPPVFHLNSTERQTICFDAELHVFNGTRKHCPYRRSANNFDFHLSVSGSRVCLQACRKETRRMAFPLCRRPECSPKGETDLSLLH